MRQCATAAATAVATAVATTEDAMFAPDDALYDDAYALTLRRVDAMLDPHDARWATTSARDAERARAAYWKKYRVRANAALGTFVETVCELLERGARTGDETAYGRALRNCAKACGKAETALTGRERAIAVKGIGTKMCDVMEEFWRRSRAPTVTEYGETLGARNFFGAADEIAAGAGERARETPDATASASGRDAMRRNDVTNLDHLRQKAARAAEVRAAESEPAAKRARNTKPWVPGYRTAAFALLVTAHRLALEGREVLTKDELQDETEVSGLSAKGIKPKPTSRAVVGGRGAAQHYAYCGWNSFKSLKTLQNGYVEPMVNTWKKSNAMQIRLSKTGTELAAKLHAAAEARGDCSCGFAAPDENVNPRECKENDDDDDDDDDDDVAILDDAGVWTPVCSQPLPLSSQVPRVTNAAPALKNLVSPSRGEWVLPPLQGDEMYADRYETVLVVDVSETKFTERDLQFFQSAGVKTLRHSLDAGDFAWVACPKGRAPNLGDAYVLDILVERKEVNDLRASIIPSDKSGQRFVRQKYRMKNYSGMKNLVYLIEGNLRNVSAMFRRDRGGGVRTFVSTHSGMTTVDMVGRLLSARVQTEIFHGFKVVNTMHLEDTKRLLKNLTLALHATYGPLTRARATKKARTFAEYERDFREMKQKEESTVKVTWMRMLAQIDGVGAVKAQAIVEVFPTPSSLKSVVDLDRRRARVELQVIRTAAETQARSVGPSASDKILEALFPVAY